MPLEILLFITFAWTFELNERKRIYVFLFNSVPQEMYNEDNKHLTCRRAYIIKLNKCYFQTIRSTNGWINLNMWVKNFHTIDYSTALEIQLSQFPFVVSYPQGKWNPDSLLEREMSLVDLTTSIKIKLDGLNHKLVWRIVYFANYCHLRSLHNVSHGVAHSNFTLIQNVHCVHLSLLSCLCSCYFQFILLLVS